jgi:hypothetical protein
MQRDASDTFFRQTLTRQIHSLVKPSNSSSLPQSRPSSLSQQREKLRGIVRTFTQRRPQEKNRETVTSVNFIFTAGCLLGT